MTATKQPAGLGPVTDERVNDVIEGIRAQQDGLVQAMMSDPRNMANFGISVSRQKGAILYLLTRATGARRVVECASSLGVSTMYLATAVRDNGGGRVIGSEIVAEKVAAATKHLADAGLSEYAEVREGDATQTLADVGGQVDLVFLDGWPSEPPTLARTVIELLRPSLRPGALIVNDNLEPDYLDYVRDPANGFRSATLPLLLPGDNEAGNFSRSEFELTVFS